MKIKIFHSFRTCVVRVVIATHKNILNVGAKVTIIVILMFLV